MMKLKDFYNYMVENKIGNGKTRKQYQYQIRKFIRNYEPDFENFNELYKKSLEFINQNRRSWIRRYALKHFLAFMQLNEVYQSISLTMKGAKQPRRRLTRKSIAFKQIKKLVDSLEAPYNLIAALQYDTGCRISAILGLECKNFDYDEEGKPYVIVKEKGDEIRTVYLSEFTSEMIKSLIGQIGEGKIFDVKYYKTWYEIKKVADKVLGIDLSTHWLRSSRAVHLLQEGYDPVTVKDILGHKSLNTTYIYVKEAGITSKQIMEESEPKW